MEVQGRALPQPRTLSTARAWPALACLAVLAVAVIVVRAQPADSPWWTYADADATYAASALNLLRGERMQYLDHPGLPLEEAGAIAFAVDFLAERLAGSSTSRLAYVDRVLLDLDDARPVFRGLAIATYVAGALLSFLLLSRLLGHWTWGLAGGLLWTAAPGLISMSIQFRPDVPLAVLCLVSAYLIGRAVEQRSAGLYAAAGVATGFAMMVKMHAAGMLVALLIAALWRPPEPGWGGRLRASARELVHRRRVPLALVATAWLVIAVLLNVERVPFDLTGEQLAATVGPLLFLGVYLGAAVAADRLDAPRFVRRLADPFLALVGAGVVAGLLLPVTLDLPDGVQSLVNLERGLTGGGINEAHEPFEEPLDRFVDLVAPEQLLVFALAGVAALVGLWRRDPRPVVWFAGALVLGAMAQARTPNVHYFAPAFVVSIPGALWLLQRERARAASLLVWPVIAWIVIPQLQNRNGPAEEAARLRRAAAPTVAAIRERLGPGEVGLTPISWPEADTRYFGLVETSVAYTPPYPYRFLEASRSAGGFGAERGFRFRYYLGDDAGAIVGTRRITIGGIGDFLVRPAPGVELAVELLEGPGTGR